MRLRNDKEGNMIIGNTKKKEIIETKIPAITVTADANKVIRSTDVIEHLKGIAKKYTDDLDERAKAYASVKVGGNFDSDEDILSAARESVDATFAAKKGKATSQMTASRDTLTGKKDALTSDREYARRHIDDRYDRRQGRLSEKLSKGGLGTSSIADLAHEDLEEERSRAIEENNARYDRKVAETDAKIARLTASYESAMKNYEITYAIELEKEIARQKKKRDQLITTYESEHAGDRSAAYDEYIREDERRNAEYESAQGDYTGAKKENYLERYDYLLGEIKGKDPTSVKRFLERNESTLKTFLGLYYDRFVKEVS